MVDGSVEREGDGVSGPDADSLGACSASSSQVASQVVGLKIGDGGVVVGVLTDVLP